MKFESYLIIAIILLAVVFAVLEFLHIIVIKRGRTKIETEPNYWKWGIFYYNPNDPRIFVPKRIKWLGWTLNFAQPVSIIITAGVIVLIMLRMIYIPSKYFLLLDQHIT
jgi:uncharacterized membrane protein